MNGDSKELVRTITRPILLVLFAVMCFIFQLRGTEGTFVTACQYITIGGAGEWILERPVLKALKKA